MVDILKIQTDGFPDRLQKGHNVRVLEYYPESEGILRIIKIENLTLDEIWNSRIKNKPMRKDFEDFPEFSSIWTVKKAIPSERLQDVFDIDLERIKDDSFREEFFRKYPKLEAIGSELFFTKLWILLTLHEKPHTQTEISGMRCKSLRDECPEFSYLMNALNHLEEKSFAVKKLVDDDALWRLHDTTAFEIRKIKDDAELQANQKNDLYNFIENCSTEPLLNLDEDSKFNWKEIFPDILKESAKGTIRTMFALVFGA